MLYIPHYHRNSTQTCNEVPSHAGQNGWDKKNLQTINAGEVVEKNEPSYAVGMKTSTATMENSVEIP